MDFFVVDLHAIVQVQLDAAQGEVGDHLVVVAALFELLLELFLALGGSGNLTGVGAVVNHVLHPVDFGLIDALHLVEIVHTEIADGVRRVAVEIDQRLEAVLLAAVEQPVNRALLVGLAVVFEKILEEENRRILYQAIRRLEVKKREVIQMQYFGGMSQKEIAAVLHITPENVRVLAYRAKKELKKDLEELKK